MFAAKTVPRFLAKTKAPSRARGVPTCPAAFYYFDRQNGKVQLEIAQAEDYTPSSSCIHSGSGLGSAVRSSTSFSSTMRLLGGLERKARSDFAPRRIARAGSRFDL